MSDKYDWIYLSPHLDDAALSCGGQVYDQVQVDMSALIVTVMAGDPPQGDVSGYARSLHDRWELVQDAAAVRRDEDMAACRVLGADAWHWDFADCIYRTDAVTGQPFYVSDEEIFGDIHPDEETLREEIARRLDDLPPHDVLVAPLGVGRHVDHQLVRQAAEQHRGAAALLYYEDYPYAQESGAVDKLIETNPAIWHSEVVALSAVALQAKIEAIHAFRSQLSTFFVDDADLERQIRRFTEAVGGERRWRRVLPSTPEQQG